MSRKFMMGPIAAMLMAVMVMPFAAKAEAPPQKTFKVGVVQITDAFVYGDTLKGMIRELDTLGYKRGANLQIKRRVVLGATKGLWDKAQLYLALKDYIQEFADEKVDLVVTLGTPATTYGAPLAHKAGLKVMFAGVSDTELIQFRKEGWVTGSSTFLHPSVFLTELKRLLPSAKRLITTVSTDPNAERYFELLKKAAPEYGVEVTDIRVDTNADAKRAADTILTAKADAYLIIPDTWLGRDENVNGLVVYQQGARPRKLPMLTVIPESIQLFPDEVALSVGASFTSAGAAAGKQIDQILNGADPGTIPISVPEKPEIDFRQKVAERVGVQMTPELLNLAH